MNKPTPLNQSSEPLDTTSEFVPMRCMTMVLKMHEKGMHKEAHEVVSAWRKESLESSAKK